MACSYQLNFDTSEVDSMLSELHALLERRKSLPEFVDRVREIAGLLPQGIETVDLDRGATGAGDVWFALKFREPLLERLAALRAFDRDFDLVGQVHGHSFRDEV